MKFVVRTSGGIKYWDPVEDSDTGGPSLVINRMKYLLFFNTDVVNFVWKTDEGETENIVLLISVILAVHESSVDEGSWGGAEILILDQLKSYLFPAGLFHI